MSGRADAYLMLWAAELGLLVFFAWLLPAVVARMFLPLASKSAVMATNYRGVRLPVSLGIGWLVWAVLMRIPGALAVTPVGGPLWRTHSESVGLLVLGALALGLVDDVFDTGDAKGLRGHLDMLRQGRLTTGLLKLLGIGVVAFTAAAGAAQAHATTASPGRLAVVPGLGSGVGVYTGFVFVIAILIAASANVSNLLDLRPGRALKGYVIAVAVPLVWYASVGSGSLDLPGRILAVAALSVAVLGPVAALWRLDLDERAMLGDAGSNAMGVLAGWLWAVTMPPVATLVGAALAVALNLLAEKISFTAAIERVGVLRRLDGLGRSYVETAQSLTER